MKLSIIIPTLNEKSNINLIFDELSKRLKGIDYLENYEFIFIDDNSQDGSLEVFKKLNTQYPNIFKSIIRKKEKGLSGAVIEGIINSKYKYNLIIDADCQYDLDNLSKMTDEIFYSKNEIVIANRVGTDSSKEWKKTLKFFLSRIGFKTIKLFFNVDLPKDVLSGFFIAKKESIMNKINTYNKTGYKILLDIILSNKNLRFAEVPTNFSQRLYGESKMTFSVMLDFIYLIFSKKYFMPVPIKRIFFNYLVNIPSLIACYFIIFFFDKTNSFEIIYLIFLLINFSFVFISEKLILKIFNLTRTFKIMISYTIIYLIIILLYKLTSDLNFIDIIYYIFSIFLTYYSYNRKNWTLL